jgi:cyclophilin family peptidyl-prolyl cis-trans isomerase
VKFHRVIPGFVIQAGDPNSKDGNRANDGMGGSATKVKAEFTALPHHPGVLSMARGGNVDSASSQFFICVADARRALDNKYSAFGMVVEGMDVADAIVNLPRDHKDNPLPANPAIIESVVIEEREVPARPEWSVLN